MEGKTKKIIEKKLLVFSLPTPIKISPGLLIIVSLGEKEKLKKTDS